MRFEQSEISPKLYTFSPAQWLLIRGRLFLYREGLGAGARTIAWQKISQDIGNLSELGEVTLAEKNILEERFRYYMLTEPKQGKAKLSERELRDARFHISDDTLQRWFKGQDTKELLAGKKPYRPSLQKIAAIRDFLICNSSDLI